MAEILHKDLVGEDIHELRVTLGSGAPSTAPLFIGQGYYDLVNKKFYVSQGTSLLSDWITTDIPAFLTFLDTRTISWTSTVGGGGTEITYSANVEEAELILTTSNITDFSNGVLTLPEIVSLLSDQHGPLILRTGGETNPSLWDPTIFNGLELDSASQKIKLSQNLSNVGDPTFNEITLTVRLRTPLLTLTAGGTPTAASVFLDSAKGVVSRGYSGSVSSFTFQNEAGTDVLNNPVGSNQLIAPSLAAGAGAPGVVHASSSGLLSTSKLVNADVDTAAAISGTKISPDFGSQNITTTGSVLVDIVNSNNNNLSILPGTENKSLNVATGSGYNTINIGGANSIVNISGGVFLTPVEYVSSDKAIILNFGASGLSGQNSGIEIQEEHSETVSLTSAQWQSGNTVRLYTSNTSDIVVNDYLRVSGFTKSSNNGTFKVTNISTNTYLDVLNQNRTNATDDETNPATGAHLVINGYAKTGATRESWDFKSPAHSGIISLKQDGSYNMTITSTATSNVAVDFQTNLTVNQDLQKSASVEFSNIKLSGLTTGIAHLNSSGNVSSSLIVNSDVSGTAAISGTKIIPNFGNQDIQTTGAVSSNGITVWPSGLFSGQTGKISLQELVINGSNSISLRSPDSLATDVTLTLPNSVGSVNQVLSTDGTGILSWKDGGGGLLHPTSGSTFETANALMTGINNTGIGVNAGQSLTSGTRNAVYGNNAGAGLTTGSNNIAVGSFALEQNDAGGNNIAIGSLSLNSIFGGSYNLAIGSSAGQLLSTTSSFNTFINTPGLTSASTLSGTVAIGTDSAGNSATVSANNEFVFGTTNHIYKIPGKVGTAVTLGPIGTSSGQTGVLKLQELAANGTNFVALRAPDSIASDITFTLPATTGTASQVLTTDGTGTLSWSTPSSGSVSGSSITGPIYSRASGIATKIYAKNASDAVATRAVSTWKTSFTSTSSNSNSVCWSPELGLFVAVGSVGTLIRASTSPNGIDWTIRTTPESNTYESVCWSSELGLFCAVSSTGTNRVMTSPDGINWTARAAAATNAWRNVCWSPDLGLFVAVSSVGTTMYSSDGITWALGTGTTGAYGFYSVCWSSELALFVAVAPGGVATSSNGTSWTETAVAAITFVNRATVVWSPELSIFCVATESSFATSTNGTVWTSRTVPNANIWWGLAWSPELGLFCATAISGTGTRIATSADGITWTVRTNPIDNQWRSVCWSPELGIFAAMSASSAVNNGAMVSRDVGLYKERKIVPKYFFRAAQSSEAHRITSRWTARSSTTMNSSDWRSIIWSPELKIFCAVSPTSASTQVATSLDGITWTLRTPAATSGWQTVCWSAELSLFVAVAPAASITNSIMTSPDGITWTLRSQTTATDLYGVCWSPELTLFVAVGNNKVITSPDGITWTDRTPAANRVWNSVCWSSELGLFVAVGSSTGTVVTIMTSLNGTSWTTQNAVDTSSLLSVVWASDLGLFCANSNATASNQIITSPDGTTWTGYTVSATSTCDSLCYSSELRTVVALVGASVITSADGRGWVSKATVANNAWQTTAWSPELGIFASLSATGTNRSMISKNANLLSKILNIKTSRLY